MPEDCIKLPLKRLCNFLHMSTLPPQTDTRVHSPAREGVRQPTSHSSAARAPWYTHPARLIVICGVILIAVVVTATTALLLELRDNDLAQKSHELESLTSVLAEQIDRSFQLIGVIQASEIERMKNFGITSEDQFERRMSDFSNHQYLKDRVTSSRYIDAIVLTDAKGKLVNFSRTWPIPTVKVPNQDPHKAFLANPHLTEFVGIPIRSPVTGKWVLPIARKLKGPNGAFLGVVMGIIRLRYFENLFRDLVESPDDSFGLFRNDGTLLARYPRKEKIIGKRLAHPIFFRLLAKSDFGTGRRVGAIDGKERIISARRLAHYPVVLAATTTVSEALTNWRNGAVTMVAAALMIGLLIGGTVFLSIWVIGRKLREQGIQRDAALDNMSQGLVMFDEEMRLVVCNERYQQLYGVPQDFAKPGRTLFDLLTYRAESGTFSGEIETYIAQLREQIAKRHIVEQTTKTPDGRTIAIVNRSMANGGWVATHEDVTDKVKAEEETAEKKHQLDAALQNISQGLCMFDDQMRLVVCNKRYADLYGLNGDQIKPGTPLRQILERRAAVGNAPGKEKAYLEERLREVTRSQPFHVIDRLNDGRSIAIVHMPLSGGGWVSTHEDVTEREKTEEALEQANKSLVEKQFAIDQAVSVAITDVKGKIVYVNDNFCAISGYDRDDLLGHNLRISNSGLHSKRFFRQMFREVARGRVWRGEICNRTKRGSLYWVDTTIVPQLGPGGKPVAYMSIRIDITTRKLAEAKISFLANHDSLTGLANRTMLNEKLDGLLTHSYHRRESFAVLLLDLDEFKEVNDTLGHAAGDELLKEFANRLKLVLGDDNTLVRLGGDEFAIIQGLQDNQREAAAVLATKLLDLAAKPFMLNGHEVAVGASIGIALGPEDGDSAGELLQNADLALYRVKSEGRHNFCFFDKGMRAETAARLTMINDMRAALARDEFELHYQMIFDAETRRPCGAEALVRWRHPTEGFIMPDRFIRLAEESGLMAPLGTRILRRACADAVTWPRDIKVAVNLSAVQFKEPNLLDVVLHALTETGLSPDQLELEITETVFMQDKDHCQATIRQLKDLGISIVLDDFGTGYSSLSYLTAFPFDTIKIDKSFVQNLADQDERKAIVASIVTLAHGLGIGVTAEGVEATREFEFLRDAGVQQVQGFMFARPCPVTELNFSSPRLKTRSTEAA